MPQSDNFAIKEVTFHEKTDDADGDYGDALDSLELEASNTESCTPHATATEPTAEPAERQRERPAAGAEAASSPRRCGMLARLLDWLNGRS